MRKKHRRCLTQQLELFRPCVQRPGWDTLPKEVREKALQELAQLLRHASVQRRAAAAMGVDDE
jgi:hypothetical protein